jgi:hypothetical protein
MLQSSPTTETLDCPLRYVAELVGSCPDECCPFLSADGGRCGAREVALADRRTLAEWLPQARRQLRDARTPRQREEVRRLFQRLLAQMPSA